MPKEIPQGPVAVLLPSYNCQGDLNKTVATLPTDQPLHVLIVDDGSAPPLSMPPHNPAHTVEILRNEANLGIHGALRRGIENLHAAEFTYAARIDAGDFALPRRFSLQREFLDKHPEVAVVGSGFELVNELGELLYVVFPPVTDEALQRNKLLRLALSHPSVMLRVPAVIAVGNYGGDYPCAEDLDLFLRLMESHKVANLPHILTRKVEHARSITVYRRRRMIASGIRLQWRYLRPDAWRDWAGLAKSIVQLLLPRTLFERAKVFYSSISASGRPPRPPGKAKVN